MYNKNAMFTLNETAFGRNEIRGLPLFMKMWNKLLAKEKKGTIVTMESVLKLLKHQDWS